MGMSLRDMLNERPVDREAVNEHKRRMLEDVLVHRLREEDVLPQVDLAERLDVSQDRVSRIERGGIERTQIDTLRRCIEALGGSLHAEVELENQRYRPTRSRIRFVVGGVPNACPGWVAAPAGLEEAQDPDTLLLKLWPHTNLPTTRPRAGNTGTWVPALA